MDAFVKGIVNEFNESLIEDARHETSEKVRALLKRILKNQAEMKTLQEDTLRCQVDLRALQVVMPELPDVPE